MSNKFKPTNEKAKLSKISSPGCVADQYPHISFRYMTRNARHSFSYLASKTDKERAFTLSNLYRRFEEITSTSWIDLGSLSKNAGYETLPSKCFNFKGTNDETDDQKYIVFRFTTFTGSDHGRIIGFKDSPCSALFVIGFDFDFTAYDHG